MAFNINKFLLYGRKSVLQFENTIKSRCSKSLLTRKFQHESFTPTNTLQFCRSIHLSGKISNSPSETVNTFNGEKELTWEQTGIETNLTLDDSSLDTLTSPIESSLASLGLGGWTPKGLVQQGLELLHIQLDVPWWTAIAISTICIRIAIFPLVIASQRNIANLNNHMPTIQRFQDKITEARATGNVQQMMTSSNDMMAFMKTNNVNPLKNMLVPLAQLPIFISVFTGLRQMASLPVVSMQVGGLWWFSDLTIPDPTWILPGLTALTLLITIEAGVDGVKASQTGSTQIKWFIRSMPFISFPVMLNFPSAMLCYWFTSNTFSLCQVLLLKVPAVRSFFNIPQLVDHSKAYPLRNTVPTGPRPSFMESFKQSVKNLEMAHEIQEREKLRALKMRQTKNERENEK